MFILSIVYKSYVYRIFVTCLSQSLFSIPYLVFFLSAPAAKSASVIHVPLKPDSQCSKRKASSSCENPGKKVKVPDVCNPTVNESVFVSLDVLHGKLMVSECDFEIVNRPNFLGDKRINRVQVYPTCDDDYKWMSPNTIATSSFHRGKCTSCVFDGNNTCNLPSQNVPKVIFLGDEFTPPIVGSKGDCCLVLRLEATDFEQMERFLLHQIANGLKLPKGSIAVVALQTHLRRVGVPVWWSDFYVFKRVAEKHNLTVLPVITPFPEGVEFLEVIHILQLYKSLQYEHFGKKDQAHQKNYSLWKILAPLAVAHHATPVVMSAPPLRFHADNNKGSKLIKCKDTFVQGFPGDFSNGLPPQLDQNFLVAVLDELRNVVRTAAMPMAAVRIPSATSVAAGMLSDADRQLPHKGRTIFLIGGSNLGRVGKKLAQEAALLGVEVVSFCVPADHRVIFQSLSADQCSRLKNASEKDIIILDIFGNSILSLDGHYKEPLPENQSVRHSVNPRVLSNDLMNLLLADTHDILVWTSQNFPGRVQVCGPAPRYIKSCCAIQSHVCVDAYNQKLDMVAYTGVINTYLRDHVSLPNNTEFADYRNYLAGTFDADSLVDCVHFSSDVCAKYISFIIATLSKKPTPESIRPPPQKNFHDTLVEAKVYVYKGNFTPSQSEVEDDSPPSIDDAINHITPRAHPLDEENPSNPPPLVAEPAKSSSV